VGGNETITFDCRVISATNRDILQMVAEGTFREDLYYRLFQFPVRIPPLRERGQDVLILAHAFLQRFIDQHPEFKGKRLASESVRAIEAYAWPGNVRELKSVVERAVLISDQDAIAVGDLLLDLPGAVSPWTQRTRNAPAPTRAVASGDGMPAHVTEAEPVLAIAEPAPVEADEIVPFEEMKRRAVERAYESCAGNVDRAAAELGIGRATMYRLMKKYGMGGEEN
jgi:DNA-binding NtrC family response regulator